MLLKTKHGPFSQAGRRGFEPRLPLHQINNLGTNASYAAGFGGSTLILHDPDLPNGARVTLSNGRAGIFRRVSCGGSCAPANLWWVQNGVMYQIQVKLRPDLPEKDQQKILVETANSTVAVR
jgi:hypothetical protein